MGDEPCQVLLSGRLLHLGAAAFFLAALKGIVETPVLERGASQERLLAAQLSAPDAAIVPYEIHVDNAVLTDLRDRLRGARFPDEVGQSWGCGTDLAYLKELVAYWRDEFDWRAQERRLNQFDQFMTNIDGLDIHFIHQRSPDPDAQPLLLLNGWPPAFGLVELHVDGETQGFYLLVDKVAEALVRDHGPLRSVIRRTTDIRGTRPEIKVGYPSDAAAHADYDALLANAEELEGNALVTLLEDRLDLNAYLRWVAFNSAVQSGDYIDELWLFATDSLASDGRTVSRYGVVGWDPDDVFSICHDGGIHAIVDPWGLLYCTESVLDHLIFDDPEDYRRYVDVLDGMLGGVLSADAVAQTPAAVADQVLPWLESQDIAAAMFERVAHNPEAVNPAVAAPRCAAPSPSWSTISRHNVSVCASGLPLTGPRARRGDHLGSQLP